MNILRLFPHSAGFTVLVGASSALISMVNTTYFTTIESKTSTVAIVAQNTNLIGMLKNSIINAVLGAISIS